MRRVSVIKFRECPDTMFAYILEKAFNEIIGLVAEHRAHHLEAYVNIRSEQIRERTALMVCEVTVYLGAFIHSLISLITLSPLFVRSSSFIVITVSETTSSSTAT